MQENPLYKSIEYKGKFYTAVPEMISKHCKGCVFENKNSCYNKPEILKVCRQGFIFTKIENTIDYMKEYKRNNKK